MVIILALYERGRLNILITIEMKVKSRREK